MRFSHVCNVCHSGGSVWLCHYLLDQTEVLNELPLSLSELIDHLQGGRDMWSDKWNHSQPPSCGCKHTACTSGRIHRWTACAFTADCSIKEVEPPVPAHILFHNPRVELLHRNEEQALVTPPTCNHNPTAWPTYPPHTHTQKHTETRTLTSFILNGQTGCTVL